MATPLHLTSTLPPKPPPLKELPAHHLLEKCISMAELKRVHARMIRFGLAFDPFPASRLVAVCAAEEFGSLDYARLVFRQIPNPTTFTSNAIIRGYTNKNLPSVALFFYTELLESGRLPDRFTLPSLFKSCRSLKDGNQLHAHAVKLGFASDVYVQNTLMNMYSSCGCLSSANQLFDKMCERTIVSWATMIAAYTKSDRLDEALDLHRKMEMEDVTPNDVTLVNVLTACARARDLGTGKRIHRKYIEQNRIEFNLVLWAALLDFYCKCGCVSIARKLFDEMHERNLFCWNIMIKGHAEDGNYKEALQLFHDMQLTGIKADKVTMACLVQVCSQIGALELGKWFHAYIEREKIEVDAILGTALVDMYARCGCLESALKVFENMPSRDVLTWTALIGGLATCGHAERALETFYKMKRRGVMPDAVTFVGVLTACSHAGLVDEGRAHFESMATDHKIQPSAEHYCCMVNLLGRAGEIEKADELIRSMPMAPDFFVLRSLLNACRVHHSLEVAERTARKLFEIDEKHKGAYVLISNMYRSMHKWDEAQRISELMPHRNVKKSVGCSLIELDGKVYEFVIGDKSHPESAEIYAMVEDMVAKLKEAGYVPNKAVVLDMDEEEKDSALCRHSEKLAIAFGLLKSRPGVPIRVMKNLRVCSDCHAALKLISKVYEREIVVRDRYCFHHFRDGSCSCKDFG